MKKGIHPENYRLVVFKDTSCDHSFLTRSTVETNDTIKWEDGNEYPLLVISESYLGKTAVWTSDVGPHWLPNDFVEWKGYKTLWNNLFNWLTD